MGKETGGKPVPAIWLESTKQTRMPLPVCIILMGLEQTWSHVERIQHRCTEDPDTSHLILLNLVPHLLKTLVGTDLEPSKHLISYIHIVISDLHIVKCPLI